MIFFVRLMSNLVFANIGLFLFVRYILQEVMGEFGKVQKVFFCRLVYFFIIFVSRGGNNDFLGILVVFLFNNNYLSLIYIRY